MGPLSYIVVIPHWQHLVEEEGTEVGGPSQEGPPPQGLSLFVSIYLFMVLLCIPASCSAYEETTCQTLAPKEMPVFL